MMLLILLLYQVLMHCSCSTDIIATSATNQTTANEDPRAVFRKSYIQKFSSSWRLYAKANDITKREKLRQALTDALHSIDVKRKSDVPSNTESNNVKRIKQAATLLKEFKKMYTLSENVKRTMKAYKEARRNLTTVAYTKKGLDILKRFLVAHEHNNNNFNSQKRNFIPLLEDTEELIENDDDDPPEEESSAPAQYITKTSKISVKAKLLDNSGKIGLEYASVDPRTSTMEKAQKAFNAAKILMTYIRGNEKSKVTSMIDSLEVHHANSTVAADTEQKSVLPAQDHDNDNSNIHESGLTHIASSSPALESTASPKNASAMESLVVDEDKQKNEIGKGNSGTDKRFNPFLALLHLKQKNESLTAIQKKNITSKEENSSHGDSNEKGAKENGDNNKDEGGNNSGHERESGSVSGSADNKANATSDSTSSPDTTDKLLTQIAKETINFANNETDVESTEIANKSSVAEPDFKSEAKVKSLDSVVLLKKQQDAVLRLQEAKEARQKYEVAKHDLAQKVKELYDMANQYEKQETNDQILEEKNKIFRHIEKSSDILPNPAEEGKQEQNEKRDNDHPGIALSQIQNHIVKDINVEGGDDGAHRGFTMGSKDKVAHQVELEDPKPDEDVKKVYDIGLPSSVKLGDQDKTVAKKSEKSQEDTLKVIAQAIQEDMRDISDSKKKKKQLLSSIDPGNVKNTTQGKKKTDQANDKIDEYLTKALSDIMGNDTDSSTKSASSTSSTDSSNTDSSEEANRKIVEKAMTNHMKHPDMPLPLLQNDGTKIVLNKPDDARKSNDVVTHASDHDKKPGSKLDLSDPSNQVLLDKASHMEEQVAAAQDNLYSDEPPQRDPAAAPSNIDSSPVQMSPPDPVRQMAGDPYGTIEQQTQGAPAQPAAERSDEAPDAEDADDPEEDEDDEENYHHHHRRHHNYEPEEEEEDNDREDEGEEDEEDDGEEDDDKKSRVGYREEIGKKRTLPSSTKGSTGNKTVSAKNETAKTSAKVASSGNTADMEEKHSIEELEDAKKSFVPKQNATSWKTNST